MVARVTAVSARSLYLLGDLDKPFGIFDTLTYGWKSIIEAMRIRAEFRKRAYEKAKEIRRKTVKFKDEGILLAEGKDDKSAEDRVKNSWIMMTPSVALQSGSEVDGEVL
jgi:hypothetical protein